MRYMFEKSFTTAPGATLDINGHEEVIKAMFAYLSKQPEMLYLVTTKTVGETTIFKADMCVYKPATIRKLANMMQKVLDGEYAEDDANEGKLYTLLNSIMKGEMEEVEPLDNIADWLNNLTINEAVKLIEQIKLIKNI